MSDQWPPPPDWYYRVPLSDVRKIGAQVPMSTEELMRSWGIGKPVPASRLTRLRWAWQAWRYNHRPHLHLGPCDPEERL